MDNEQFKSAETSLVSYRSFYQEYSSLFGIFGLPYLEVPHFEANQAHSGYIINKSISELTKRVTGIGGIAYIIYDHIRQIQELLTGLFSVSDDEFRLIIREFMAEFIMDEVCLIYSEEVKLLEEYLLEQTIKSTGEDIWKRKQKAKFDSNYRLFRRTYDDKNQKYKWKSILTDITDIELTPEQESQMRLLSFNEGFFFIRLFRIFSNYEAQMQSYLRLFKVMHTPVKINAVSSTGIENKITELLSAQVHLTHDIKHPGEVTSTEFQKYIPHLDLSYHVIQTQLNDDLARLGLSGDDSTKCERVTTGENFRALQPNHTFQQAILIELNKIGALINKPELKFEKALVPNEQGVPIDHDKSYRHSIKNSGKVLHRTREDNSGV